MEADPPPTGRNLDVAERVRCLDCGAVYAKPAGGGTVRGNPGCPECGYIGWLAVNIPVNRGLSQHRFFEGRLRHRSA